MNVRFPVPLHIGRPSLEFGLAVAGLSAISAYTLGLGWMMEHGSYDVWGGLRRLPLLAAASMPIMWRIGRDDAVPMPALLGLAVTAKLLASIVRYFVVFQVYGGVADASTYNEAGKAISNDFRVGKLSVLELLPHSQGTKFLGQLVGLLYAVTGPTKLGGFIVFSWIGFWGLFLMYRAAVIGFPEGDIRRYAILLFFAPSLLFWPSSLGKESWMMLALGVTFYGAARLLTHHRGGLLLTALGSLMAGYVRPHVAAVAGAALVVAFLFRRTETKGSLASPAKKIAGMIVLIVGLSVAIAQTGTRFTGAAPGSNGALSGITNISSILDTASRQSSGGGSSIEVESPNSPLQFPRAFLSVMFRPTLLEARSSTAAIAALEATALFVFFGLSWRRLKQLPFWLFKRPYVLFCVVYVCIFAFAWSSIGNLAIIARQRVLAWPFIFILLAVRPEAPHRRVSVIASPQARPRTRLLS